MPGYEYMVHVIDLRDEYLRWSWHTRWSIERRRQAEKEFWIPLWDRVRSEVRELGEDGWEPDGALEDAIHWEKSFPSYWSNSLIRSIIATVNPVDWVIGEVPGENIYEARVALRRAITPTSVRVGDRGPDPMQDENKHCIFCGMTLPPAAVFCSRCGKEQA
jgi:hypothetical protein